MIATGNRYALLIGIWLLVVPFTAHADQGGDEAPGMDPLVAQVVEMLGAGVDEEVISQWLASTDRRPTDVGAQGLIALTQAGASRELMGQLLELVAVASPDPKSAPEPLAPVLVPPPTDERRSVPAVPEPDSEAAYPAASIDTPADVLFLLGYKKTVTQEPEPDSPPPAPWTVYAYLDGELVAWVTDSLAGEPVRATRLLSPGRHLLRVTQERHIQRGQRWIHESRVAPNLIAFDVVPGEEMEVEIKFQGHWIYRASRGPLTFAVRRGFQTVVADGPTGGDPSQWQPVCEDVEANFAEADKVPRLYRRDMARCTPWSTLWNGAGEQMSRTELLAEMGKSDFQPTFR
ncbi:MAG: hypothetical protein WBH85_19235 [Thermoanaerobaculia bacterium]